MNAYSSKSKFKYRVYIVITPKASKLLDLRGFVLYLKTGK